MEMRQQLWKSKTFAQVRQQQKKVIRKTKTKHLNSKNNKDNI